MFKNFSALLLTLVASTAFSQTVLPVTIAGASITLPAPVPGPAGAPGAPGAQGPAGPQGAAGVSPTPAAVAAACVASPPCVAAIAAAVSVPVVTPPPVTTPPPVVTPPPVTSPPVVGLPVVGLKNAIGQPLDAYVNGKMNWTNNFNYGGITETDNVIGPDGQPAVLFTAATGPTTAGSHPGGGGALPVMGHSPNGPGNFDTTGSNFLIMVLAPTRPGQSWNVIFDEPGPVDTEVPNSGIFGLEKFCAPAPTVGVYSVCKVSKAQMGLSATQILVKFGIQDQDPYADAPTVASGNQWYIKRAVWSAN